MNPACLHYIAEPFTLGFSWSPLNAHLSTIVSIERIVRRMRGGSQSQLVQADDGFYYVAKFNGNPQGSRTLINEWIAGRLLQKLGILTPELRVLRLNEACCADDLFFQVGSRRKRVEGALHLGSRCPVNPETTAIFEILPTRVLDRVANVADFGRVFVVDCWLGQSDTRQAIYIRNRGTKDVNFSAWMIDHGHGFGGSEWDLKAVGIVRHCHCFNFNVYNFIDMSAVIEETVAAISALPDEAIYAATNHIPEEWLAAGDREELSKILYAVNRRRGHLQNIAMRCWSGVEQRQRHRRVTIPPEPTAAPTAHL